jgi:hypothetical protein
VEATVQAFCVNKTVSRIPRNGHFAAHVQPACERIMLGTLLPPLVSIPAAHLRHSTGRERLGSPILQILQ